MIVNSRKDQIGNHLMLINKTFDQVDHCKNVHN